MAASKRHQDGLCATGRRMPFIARRDLVGAGEQRSGSQRASEAPGLCRGVEPAVGHQLADDARQLHGEPLQLHARVDRDVQQVDREVDQHVDRRDDEQGGVRSVLERGHGASRDVRIVSRTT